MRKRVKKQAIYENLSFLSDSRAGQPGGEPDGGRRQDDHHQQHQGDHALNPLENHLLHDENKKFNSSLLIKCWFLSFKSFQCLSLLNVFQTYFYYFVTLTYSIYYLHIRMCRKCDFFTHHAQHKQTQITILRRETPFPRF